MRLQKYLADAGIASRRKCEQLIEEGKITVNGQAALVGMSVDPENDTVLYLGEPVTARGTNIVIAFNKPKGVISSMSDPEGRKCIGDFFMDFDYRIYNIGRLDYNTSGLLLLTNNGELANRLMHPKYEVNKTYFVKLDTVVRETAIEKLEQGVVLDDGVTAPAKVDFLRSKNGLSVFELTIHEGRNRQVRRMMSAIGYNVLELKRVTVGPVKLGDLKTGEWRYLTSQELAALIKI